MWKKKKKMPDLFTYKKDVLWESTSKAEADIEVLNIDTEGPNLNSLTDGEITEMCLSQGDCNNSGNKEDVNTAEKIEYSKNVYCAY